MTLQLWGAVLLVSLALLLGASWAQQYKLRQVVERRRLDEERAAVCATRWQRGACPYCASPRSERDCFFASKIVEERPDDD